AGGVLLLTGILVGWLLSRGGGDGKRLARPGEPDPRPPPAPGRPLTNSIGMRLVPIPPGQFTMGSPGTETDRSDNEGEHEVKITRPFLLGAYEVTQAQYEQVMGKNPSRFNKDNGGGPDHP